MSVVSGERAGVVWGVIDPRLDSANLARVDRVPDDGPTPSGAALIQLEPLSPTLASGTLPGRSARDNALVCSLCGTLYSTRHWAEAPGAGAAVDARRAWMRDRLRRVELLN